LHNDQLIELFLETRRSRSGKIQHLTNEQIFSMIVQNHLLKVDHAKDLVFVPVTINYDRVIEGEVFPNDLLGEGPIKESFFRAFMQMISVKKNVGKVYVRYGAPYSLNHHLVGQLAVLGVTR
jgi:glycerol-3-phosphate O-acyltransferase